MFAIVVFFERLIDRMPDTLSFATMKISMAVSQDQVMDHVRMQQQNDVQGNIDRRNLLSRRLVVSIGMAVFLGIYLLVLDRMGIWQGIAIAWFPSALVSWGITMTLFRAIRFWLRP